MLLRQGNKAKQLLTLTLLAASITSYAQSNKSANSFSPSNYIGLGFGASKLGPEGQTNGFAVDDDSGSGYKIFIGRQFSPRWSGEFSYTDLGAAGLGNLQNATLDAAVPNAELSFKVPAFWVAYEPFES